MQTMLKIEEFFLLILAFSLFLHLGAPAWLFFALLLAPDLGLLGYLFGPKAGAFTYNLLHHKGLAIALYFAGFHAHSDALQIAGIIMLAHSSMDRVFGYGLKYAESFHKTHLGIIGGKAQ